MKTKIKKAKKYNGNYIKKKTVTMKNTYFEKLTIFLALLSFSYTLQAGIYKGHPNQHVPVVITIDPGRQETPNEQKLGAVTFEFIMALKLKTSHVVVSQTILHNFLTQSGVIP